MARTARIILTRVQLETMKLRGSLTVKLPPDVDTLRIEIEDGSENSKALANLLSSLFGQF